jgi:putative salt-induced outer membrane protein YdiY
MRALGRIFLLLVGFSLVNSTTVFPDEVGLKDGESLTGAVALELSGHLNIGATATDGNTDTENYYLDGELVARTAESRYTAGALVNYAEDEAKTTTDNWTCYLKYDRFVNQNWYLYGNGVFKQDEFKDIDLRTSLGTGIGYQFLETELSNLSAEGGLSYVNEDLSEADDKSYAAGRWSASIDRYLVPGQVKFFHFHEVLVGLEGDKNSIVHTQTGFRFPLCRNFIASTQVNYDWEKEPTSGTKKTDRMYIFTLGYEW